MRRRVDKAEAFEGPIEEAHRSLCVSPAKIGGAIVRRNMKALRRAGRPIRRTPWFAAGGDDGVEQTGEARGEVVDPHRDHPVGAGHARAGDARFAQSRQMVADIALRRLVVERLAGRLALFEQLRDDLAPRRLAQRFEDGRKLDLVALGVVQFLGHVRHIGVVLLDGRPLIPFPRPGKSLPPGKTRRWREPPDEGPCCGQISLKRQ